MAIWVLLILWQSAKNRSVLLYGVVFVVFYRCGLLSFSFRAFPFLISICVPFWRVPFFRWGRWWWLRGIFIFAVFFFWWSRFRWLRDTILAYLFFAVLFFWWSRFRWPRDTILIPFWMSSFRWSRFCWPRGTNLFLAVRFLQWGRSLWPWGTSLFFAVDHSLTSRLWAYWVFCLQVVHWHLFCVHQKFFFPPWMVSSIKWSWTETKHSPAWALAKMVLIWPQESCFSPVVAGVCGLPFKWHDAGLPQWSLQIRNPGWIPATFENWISFASTLSFSFLIFDYFWPCPLLSITKGPFL